MKPAKLLKRVRIVLSAAILILITLLFLNLGEWYGRWFGFLAKIQLLPAVLSLCLGAVIFWFFVTLFIGRIYCSTVCPLGIAQDFFAWLRTNRKGTYGGYHYSSSRNITRYTILGVCVVCVIAGIMIFPMLIDPYSTYGRFVNSTLLPARNFLIEDGKATLFSYSIAGLAIGIITFAIIAGIAYKRGRFICNTICPVGSALSLISRQSVFKMEIDTDRCVGCGHCEYVCKSECINLNDHVIDTSRCVMCLNCLEACHFDALHFTANRKRLATPLIQTVPDLEAPVANIDRRQFLTLTVLTVAGGKIAMARNAKHRIEGSEPIKNKYPVTPPGTKSREDFFHKCTACMLCVSNCPTKVLKPSTTEYGILKMLRPVMDFNHAACAENCTKCTEVCPTGALSLLTLGTKRISPIGTAHVITKNCIGCGVCASVCPYDAIEMQSLPNGNYCPSVNEDKCVGCGTCQSKCPASPVKAIWVEGKP